MTWSNRIKLVTGLMVVLVLVAAGTLIFNQRQHHAQSTSAAIVAESYPVGTDYGGIVTRQYAQIGDEVTAGTALFDVRSLQLQRDAASGYVDPTALGALGSDGTSTVVATVDGTLASVAVPQGGFAQAGAVLGTLDRSQSLFVDAEFLLSARDYARITAGSQAEVRLPDQSVLTGVVANIDVETIEGQALSTVRITSDALAQATATGLFEPGTPVAVTLQLRDDGPLAGVADAARDLMRKIGL